MEYKCDLLADDELFDKLKSEENMSIFGDIEDASSNVSTQKLLTIK